MSNKNEESVMAVQVLTRAECERLGVELTEVLTVEEMPVVTDGDNSRGVVLMVFAARRYLGSVLRVRRPRPHTRTTRHLYLQACIVEVFGEEPLWYDEETAESQHPYAYAMEVGLVPVTFTRSCTECGRKMWPLGQLTAMYVTAAGLTAMYVTAAGMAAGLAAAEWNDNLCAECVHALYMQAREASFATWRAWKMGGEA